jgi:hypothetical protein
VGKHVVQKGFFFFNLSVVFPISTRSWRFLAAKSTSRASAAKLGFTMDGTSRPIILACPVLSCCATRFGKVIQRLHALLDTRQGFSPHLIGEPLSTLDTVLTETPACFATSRIFAIHLLCGNDEWRKTLIPGIAIFSGIMNYNGLV